ncbi:MAG: CDP-2,3-bis-(O-geranylgeranyl)-sn-glycerol synthase [Desulfurococcales archaeon]|nr:CDP-2,3-bis-(O-geranylgeranyl)-sn-glycerol synthase [Desulfurococcales archaeon]
MDLRSLFETLLYILPAMTANGSPVVASRFYGKGTPIDGGRSLGGKRLLGDGKTWEGLATGTIVGLLTGIIIGVLLDRPVAYWASIGALSGFGAMLGDIVGSFIKRRLGLPRGSPAPLLDQLDFYVGALVVLYFVGVRLSLSSVIIWAVIIFFLHRATNYLAYKLKLKSVPH